MSAEVIYRSSHPSVLAAWEEGQIEFARYRSDRGAALAEWGFRPDQPLYRSNSALAGAYWEGIAWDEAELPKYWRRDRDTREMIVPDRKSVAGKRLSDQFQALRAEPSPRSQLEALGMPHMHMHAERAGMMCSSYAANLPTTDDAADAVLWIKWTVDVPGVDASFWERVPLSEYYALVESGRDPFAVPVGEGA